MLDVWIEKSEAQMLGELLETNTVISQEVRVYALGMGMRKGSLGVKKSRIKKINEIMKSPPGSQVAKKYGTGY